MYFSTCILLHFGPKKSLKKDFFLYTRKDIIDTIFYNGAIKIKTIDKEQINFLVSGHRLRLYHKQLTREEFVKYLQENSEFKLVKEWDSSPHSPASL